MRFLWFALRHNLLDGNFVPGRTNHDPATWRRFTTSFSTDSCHKLAPPHEPIRVSTRVRVAHRVLAALADSLHVAAHRPLRIWFTVAFKHEHDGARHVQNRQRLNSSVGVICTTFSRGESAASLERKLQASKSHALGTYFGMKLSKGRTSAKQGARARAWADIAVSLAQIRGAKNIGRGGLRSCISSPGYGMPFSVYFGALTFGERCHVGLTISTQDFNPAPLKRAFPGAALALVPLHSDRQPAWQPRKQA